MNEIRKIVTRLLLAVVISLVFGSATRLFDPLVLNTSSAQNNSTGNATASMPEQSSNSTGNGLMSQENNSTGNVAPPQVSSNNTGNGPMSQQSINTQNLRSGPCPYNENITCDNPEPVNGTGNATTASPEQNNSTGNATAPSQTSNTTGNATAPQASSNNTDFVNTILQIVNRERASVGVPPLTWSDSLAAVSKTWADHLVAINQMVHATDAEKGGPFGETIAGSCGNSCGGFAARVAQMVEGWVSEKASYHGEPINSTNYRVFGHYTQIVWRNEQQIGCGMATANGQDYLVCRYNLPGNYLGQKP